MQSAASHSVSPRHSSPLLTATLMIMSLAVPRTAVTQATSDSTDAPRPPSTSAAAPTPAERIRVTRPGQPAVVGYLAEESETGLLVYRTGGRGNLFGPWHEVREVQTSKGPGRLFDRSGALTIATTSALLSVVMAAAYQPCGRELGCILEVPGTRTGAALVGAALGLPLGILLAAAATSEQWEARDTPPAPTGVTQTSGDRAAPRAKQDAPRLTLRPVVGQSFGVSGSIRIGGR